MTLTLARGLWQAHRSEKASVCEARVHHSPPFSAIHFPPGWRNTFPKMAAGKPSESQWKLWLPPWREPPQLPKQRQGMASPGGKALSPTDAGNPGPSKESPTRSWALLSLPTSGQALGCPYPVACCHPSRQLKFLGLLCLPLFRAMTNKIKSQPYLASTVAWHCPGVLRVLPPYTPGKLGRDTIIMPLYRCENRSLEGLLKFLPLVGLVWSLV